MDQPPEKPGSAHQSTPKPTNEEGEAPASEEVEGVIRLARLLSARLNEADIREPLCDVRPSRQRHELMGLVSAINLRATLIQQAVHRAREQARSANLERYPLIESIPLTDAPGLNPGINIKEQGEGEGEGEIMTTIADQAP